jgi:16S rRNA (adenine1518-N6/adenine1519-N6)-dimethyltransferase
MMAADGLPPLRDVIAKYELGAKKSLGQNFLLDLNLTGRIARSAGDLTQTTIIEIGPGPGGLTRALLANGAKKVIAVERDERCLPALAEIAAHYPDRLQVIAGDAMTVPLADYLLPDEPCRIVANLPYNIGTALLIGWLETMPWPPFFESLTLMFQREVAERIVATPHEQKEYGRLAVISNWRCDTKILFDVSPSAFTPPPKVTSSVVQLIPRPHPQPCNMQTLSRVTAAAFGQRRKMLRQSLKALGADPLALLASVGIEPTLRAETVAVEGFVALAQAYDALGQHE